jgi:hypothetical protein
MTEQETFDAAIKKVLCVSKTELQRRLQLEQTAEELKRGVTARQLPMSK